MGSGKDIVFCMNCGALNWSWNECCWHCGVSMDDETQAMHEDIRHERDENLALGDKE